MSMTATTFGFGKVPLTPAQAKLVEDNLGLCYSMMNRYSMIHHDDQAACLAEAALPGLIASARRFNPTRGCKFSTLACHAIKQHIWRHFRTTNLRNGRQYVTPIDEMVMDQSAKPMPTEHPDVKLDAEALLRRLHGEHHAVIHMRYFEGKTLREIGKIIGHTGQGVKYIHDRAMKLMRA